MYINVYTYANLYLYKYYTIKYRIYISIVFRSELNETKLLRQISCNVVYI